MIVLAVIGILAVVGILVFLAAIGLTSAVPVLVVGLTLLLLAMHGGTRATRRR